MDADLLRSGFCTSLKAHLQLVSMPNSGAWLHGFPCRTAITLIDAPLFRIAVERRLRMPLQQEPSAQEEWTLTQTTSLFACAKVTELYFTTPYETQPITSRKHRPCTWSRKAQVCSPPTRRRYNPREYYSQGSTASRHLVTCIDGEWCSAMGFCRDQ